MKATDARGGMETMVDVRPRRGRFDPLPPKHGEVDLRRLDDELVLAFREQVVPIVGVDARAQAALAAAIDDGLPRLAWAVFADEARVTLQIRRFHGMLRFDDPLVLAIDDRLLADLRARHGVGGTVADVAGWLDERLLLDGPGALRRAVIQAGPKGSSDAFRMFGRGVAVDVRRSQDRLIVQRVVRAAPAEDTVVHLLVAPISFADRTAAGEIATAARHALEEALRDSGSYLQIWSTYAQMERDALLRRARRVGTLRYERCERRGDGGFRFHLAEDDAIEARLSALGDDARYELEAGEEARDLDRLDAPQPERSRLDRHAAPLLGADAERRTVDLRGPEDDEDLPAPPPQGYLYLCLVGDLASLKRREHAEARLRQGNCPMPQLGLLLEGRPVMCGNHRRQTAERASVREAFSGRPTRRQLDAIEVALNTPDIALIQGPPGTGKTKVITALQRCLAELYDEGVERSHRILVTSAQHDAVENVVERSEVFGLPAVKVGSRRGADGGAVDSVEKFREDRIERLRATLPEMPESARLVDARHIAVACLAAPTPRAATAAHLRDLSRLLGEIISPDLRDRLEQQAHALSRPSAAAGDPETIALRRAAAEGIRTTAEGFLDDGPVKAHKALSRLAEVLRLNERARLAEAAAWTGDRAPPWLADLAIIRDDLIDRLAAPAVEAAPLVDQATRALVVDVINAVEERQMRSIHGEPGVLAAYLDDLEHDPAAVREALEHYTVVLAATCQQAAGGAMRAIRGITAGSADFETVIVDEAARVNPLDLFIPMSMAKRRVVLVGDHRQLPHMLEPEVEREVAGAVARGDLVAEAEEALKTSLFGRLWGLLKQLEAQDGVRRTVQLNTQFRMHPLLGTFVSEHFYRGQLESGTSAEAFAHELPGYSKNGRPAIAAWLDVPGGRNRTERRGQSKSRDVEARAIAREVRRLIELDPRLTFGVIAFYKAQEKSLGAAFVREGLAQATEAGGYRLADRWLRTEDRRERLRLGTVDAFQGKEFDVVFLSVTRSNDLPGDTDEQRRRKYGHLLLANRLCVAMSRQHRLLIVAGDRAFAACDALGPLAAFSKLCEGRNGVVRT